MNDPRIVYGARCSWWDSIDKVGTTSTGLPCCPFCSSVLFEVPTEDDWWTNVDAHEADGHPGYRRYVEQLRGRDCRISDQVTITIPLEVTLPRDGLSFDMIATALRSLTDAVGQGKFPMDDLLAQPTSPADLEYIDIVFDGPPGPESGRFVEAEDMNERSVSIGEWVEDGRGYWRLRLPVAADKIRR